MIVSVPGTSRAMALVLVATVLPAAALAAAAVPQIGLAASAEAQPPAFVSIGTFGAFRVDALREGTAQGQPVRLVDMTLHNLSAVTTFPETIQAVSYRAHGRSIAVKAVRRDLTAFGRFDVIAPGQQVKVTYVVPMQAEISGIWADYMQAPLGQRERRWTWQDLGAGAAGTVYFMGRPQPGAPVESGQDGNRPPGDDADRAAPNAANPLTALDPSAAAQSGKPPRKAARHLRNLFRGAQP